VRDFLYDLWFEEGDADEGDCQKAGAFDGGKAGAAATAAPLEEGKP
jgi:hypothetical protein